MPIMSRGIRCKAVAAQFARRYRSGSDTVSYKPKQRPNLNRRTLIRETDGTNVAPSNSIQPRRIHGQTKTRNAQERRNQEPRTNRWRDPPVGPESHSPQRSSDPAHRGFPSDRAWRHQAARRSTRHQPRLHQQRQASAEFLKPRRQRAATDPGWWESKERWRETAEGNVRPLIEDVHRLRLREPIAPDSRSRKRLNRYFGNSIFTTLNTPDCDSSSTSKSFVPAVAKVACPLMFM